MPTNGNHQCDACGSRVPIGGGKIFGSHGAPRVVTENGKCLGAGPKTRKGVPCSLSDLATELCELDEKLDAAAILAGATAVFSLQLRWWWQINYWVNVGVQDAETFALIRVMYGNEVPYFQTGRAFDGSTINGVAYGPANGIDIRSWNLAAWVDHYFPTPANGWEDPVEYQFLNNAGTTQDLELQVSGPAVIQI